MLLDRIYADPESLTLGSTDEKTVTQEFRTKLERLAAIGRSEGMSLSPYEDSALPKFQALPLASRIQLLDAITLYTEVMESTQAHRESVRYNLNSVWRMLGRLRLRAGAGIFEILEPQDIVEIYTPGGLQIFRSFHFFEVCSYSLEDLFCVPWYSLFIRPPGVDQIFFNNFKSIAAGQLAGVGPGELPAHEVRERFGPKDLTTLAECRLAAPLFGRGEPPRGVMHAFRVKVTQGAHYNA